MVVTSISTKVSLSITLESINPIVKILKTKVGYGSLGGPHVSNVVVSTISTEVSLSIRLESVNPVIQILKTEVSG